MRMFLLSTIADPTMQIFANTVLIAENNGLYTAIVRGAGGTAGVASVEIYDLE